MMQIVHDLSPGSPLDFATAFLSEASFASNITALAAQGAKVIVDDVTYFDEPMYQDGIVEQAITGVRAQGVDYFSSAANNRQILNGHEVGSYEAVNGYRPVPCPAIAGITGHADCHDFGGGDTTFTYEPANAQTIRAIMNWGEAWSAVNTDLDLYLINQAAGTVLASSATADTGGGSQRTFEFIAGTQTAPAGASWAFVVARKSSAAPSATPRFKIVFAENGAHPFVSMEREVPTPGTGDVMGPTVFGHNGGASVMSVGASDVRVAPTALNTYSSYGPVTTLFGPVNGSTPAAPLSSPRVLNKPDLVASDCNVNTFFGGAGPTFRFCGTSSAAPHAASVFALLRQKFPSATTEAINAAMVATATPIAGVPASFQGAGLVNAQAAPGAVVLPQPPAPDTTLTKTPKKTVKTKKKKVKVSFSFASTIAGSTFACSIDGKAFTACASGVTYKLKKGKHTFAVRATAAGVTDPTPATYSFKIKRKKKH